MDTIVLLTALYTEAGAGTIYLGPAGNPLLCDRPHSPLTYSRATPRWVAFPIDKFLTKEVECWDVVLVREYREDGTTRSFMAYVLDAGNFGEHTRIGGLPIVVDVAPWNATWPLYPGWVKVEVINFSAIARACRERGLCD